jgi:Tfp pilus assembly protein FimT
MNHENPSESSVCRRTARGFTLFEVMLVSIFVITLFHLVSIFGISAIHVQDIDQAREIIRSELVSARDRAAAGDCDVKWGAAFSTSTVTQFKGESYASRDPAYDRTNDLGNRVSLSGADEIVFMPPFGEACASGTVNVTDGTRSAIITVNQYGTIEVQ